jgi:hypothetical protein
VKIWLIDSSVHHDRGEDGVSPQNSEFVLCGRDVDTFCRAIMGNTTFEIQAPLSSTTRHTLASTTNFHEANIRPDFLARHTIHRQVLQPFRKRLRGFTNISLQGSSVGLSRVLAATAMKDFRSQLIPDPYELLDELKDMLSLYNKVLETGTTNVYELIAPFEKAMALCVRTTIDSNLWTAIQRKARDRSTFVRKFMSEAYRMIVLRHITYDKYGPWQDDSHIVFEALLPQISPLGPALQTYEMCLAMAKAFGFPDWTPDPIWELDMSINVVGALAPFRYFMQTEEQQAEIALAIGYKAAKRAVELAPGDKIFKQWMEWYEDWKQEGIQLEMFYTVDHDVMEDRGMIRWSASDPGVLSLS